MKKLMVVGAAFAFMGVAAVELPDGYTAVDWIESTKGGKQFIDTGYIANGLTKVVFDVRIPERGTGQQGDDFGVLFGACTMNDSPANAFALQMCDGSTGGNNVRFIYNDANRQSDDKPFSYGERVTVTCDGQHFEWTGSKSANVEFGADPLDHSKSTLYIFAGNTVSGDGGTKDTDGTYHSVMRLYSFKIIEGQKVIRDFVPCVRVRDQAAGLYDLAESEPVNAFYANAGTGAFDVPRVPVETTQEIDFHSMTYDTQSIYQNVTNSMGYDIGTRLRQNYLFLAPFNMSNSESSDDAFYKMAIGAAVSVVAYYFPGLGCYEFRVTRAETGCVMNYELFRWNNVNGKIRQTRLCAHSMGGKGWTNEQNSGSDASKANKDNPSFFGMFISVKNATAGTEIWCGVSYDSKLPVTTGGPYASYSGTAGNLNNGWYGMQYVDSSASKLTYGGYGVAAKDCPAKFMGLCHYDAPLKGKIVVNGNTTLQAGGKYFIYDRARKLELGDTPVYELANLDSGRWGMQGRLEIYTNTWFSSVYCAADTRKNAHGIRMLQVPDVTPWVVGENVTAYVNDVGTLVIGGTGAMCNLVSAEGAPWVDVLDEINEVIIKSGVTKIGANALDGLAGDVPVLGLTASVYNNSIRYPTGPSGVISADFDAVEIVDGKVRLGVSVYTSDAITNHNWSVATNGVIEVPAPGKNGFFILQPKGRPFNGRIVTQDP